MQSDKRKKWGNRAKWLLGVFAVLYLIGRIIEPFGGNSDFSSTLAWFLLLIGIPLGLMYKRLIHMNTAWLVYMSLIFALFATEVLLRFVVKKYSTYSEIQWSRYSSMYDHGGYRETEPEDIKRLHLSLMDPNHIRDYTTVEFDYTKERFNALGLRGKLPQKSNRVLITLGDSFTESFGAPADSTYPFLLEKHLQTWDSSIAVLNAGISGSDPFFDFKRLQSLHAQFNVSTAIFMVNHSDCMDVMTRGGNDRFLVNGLQYRKGLWWEPFYAVSHVFRVFIQSAYGLNHMLMTSKQQEEEEKKAIELIARLFEDQIKPWCNEQDINLKIVLQPLGSEVNYDYVCYSMMQKFLNQTGTDFFDLRDSLQTIPSAELLYWPIDGHFKPIGYATTANFIFNRFFKNRTLHPKKEATL